MFSPDQIRQARRADLAAYLKRHGFELRREGSQYRIAGYGGLLIRGSCWYQFSSGRGGNALDLLIKFFDMSFQEAVEGLLALEPAGISSQKHEPSHKQPVGWEFRLPERAPDNRRVAAYLTRSRGLPSSFVGWLFAKDLVFQDRRNNCVFPCYDRAGCPRGAFLRGTGSNFKGMAPGSDGRYPWRYPSETQGRLAVVCESPIDALSLVSLKPYLQDHHLVSLNGLRWEALATFLEEWQEIKTVILAFDGDKAGQTAAEEFKKRLKAQGYTVAILLPPGFKDWNETLVEARKTPG